MTPKCAHADTEPLFHHTRWLSCWWQSLNTGSLNPGTTGVLMWPSLFILKARMHYLIGTGCGRRGSYRQMRWPMQACGGHKAKSRPGSEVRDVSERVGNVSKLLFFARLSSAVWITSSPSDSQCCSTMMMFCHRPYHFLRPWRMPYFSLTATPKQLSLFPISPLLPLPPTPSPSLKNFMHTSAILLPNLITLYGLSHLFVLLTPSRPLTCLLPFTCQYMPVFLSQRPFSRCLPPPSIFCLNVASVALV